MLIADHVLWTSLNSAEKTVADGFDRMVVYMTTPLIKQSCSGRNGWIP